MVGLTGDQAPITSFQGLRLLTTTQLKTLSKQHLFLLINAGLILTTLLSGPSAFAQASNTTNLEGVDITLSLDKTRVHVGEPVILNITMENSSGVPRVNLLANFQLPEGNNLEVTVQPAGELDYRYAGAFDPGTFPSIPISLYRNDPKSLDTLLLYDRKQDSGLLFSKPGKYEVSAKFKLRIGGSVNFSTANLPPVAIDVVPAVGLDLEALGLLKEPDTIRALHLGVIPTTGSLLNTVVDLAKRYPSTAVGTLAMRAAGHYYARGNGNDLERGTQLLQDFIASGRVPVDLDGTAWTIMTSYHLNKKFDLAREWAFYLIRTYPESIRIRAEDALLYYYYYEPEQFASEIPWYLFKAPWVVPGVEPPTDLKPRQGE